VSPARRAFSDGVRPATSVFRKYGTSELEIKSERDTRVGGNSRTGQLAILRKSRDHAAGPVVAVKAGMAKIELGADVVRERVGHTAAGQTVRRDIERIDGTDGTRTTPARHMMASRKMSISVSCRRT
jgi:hypothetical protein